MFRAAAERLADEVRQEDLDAGAIFPPISALRRVTAHIAEAVVRQARADGVARDVPGDDVARRVAAAMWEPAYVRLVPA
jgi:malic enzyme